MAESAAEFVARVVDEVLPAGLAARVESELEAEKRRLLEAADAVRRRRQGSS